MKPVGYFLQAIGVLIMFLSGSCTLMIVFSSIKSLFRGNSLGQILLMGACGVVPFAIGFLIFKAGQNIVKGK